MPQIPSFTIPSWFIFVAVRRYSTRSDCSGFAFKEQCLQASQNLGTKPKYSSTKKYLKQTTSSFCLPHLSYCISSFPCSNSKALLQRMSAFAWSFLYVCWVVLSFAGKVIESQKTWQWWFSLPNPFNPSSPPQDPRKHQKLLYIFIQSCGKNWWPDDKKFSPSTAPEYNLHWNLKIMHFFRHLLESWMCYDKIIKEMGFTYNPTLICRKNLIYLVAGCPTSKLFALSSYQCN